MLIPDTFCELIFQPSSRQKTWQQIQYEFQKGFVKGQIYNVVPVIAPNSFEVSSFFNQTKADFIAFENFSNENKFLYVGEFIPQEDYRIKLNFTKSFLHRDEEKIIFIDLYGRPMFLYKNEVLILVLGEMIKFSGF